MTKNKVEKYFDKDIRTLNRTQAIYENILKQFEIFSPAPMKTSNLDTFNIVSSQIVKIIETKAKLKIIEDKYQNGY